MRAFRVALVAVGAAIVTAACAAGQDAITSEERPSVDGTERTVGSLSLDGVALWAPNGAQSYPAGASVPLTVSIANDGTSTDSLTGISSPSFTGWTIVPSAQVPSPTSTAAPGGAAATPPPQPIQPGAAVRFGFKDLTPSGTGSPRTILLKGLRAALHPAASVQLTFTFANAGSTTLSVPVQLLQTPVRQTLPPAP